MSSTTLNGASEVFTSTATANGNPPPTTQQSTSSPKEIGWWFVESYYTTLNGSPERLHLFYQKKSSFVWGIEGENVAVSHGRNEISERIKQLAFNDCKVRVTNVDSQGSLESGIIVQVLGDMINNSESSQRFAQTFFLAEQTNPRGYFVLNDIFRYLKEEEEEETAEAVPEETVEAPVEPAPEAEPVVEEKEPEVEAKEEPEEPEPVPVVEKEEVKEEVKEEEVKEETEKIEEAPVEPEAEKVEEPAAVAPVIPAVPVVPAVPVIPTPQPETSEPEPTPEAPLAVTEPVKETPQAPPPVPQEPPKPAKPASWAALLASKTPAAPTAPVATQPVAPAAPPTNTPAANTNTNTPAPAPTPSASTTAPGPSSQANSGWQTTESRRQNRPVSMSGATQNAGSAYVKNVNEKVSHKDLKAALEKFGTVNNVEIVLERKCAFVEFADGAALLAAAKENPHRINGQIIYVEERRPRPANYGGPRGGGSNLRGGERQGSRGGSQRGLGDRDRFDTNRNSIGGGRGQGGNVRGGGQYPRGGRGGAAASSN
ncbi:hypothetical protein EYR41_001205 [Orbilia oligospora]|uniref:Uncharacterized protein n=1 Tax=Orbilia oligospora TaxID=2813651 RepID=A0A7C8PET2_ORBOL|nr:hypothetical protein TWF751_002853 [Orbilia oligospora]TGJ74168.1 hypothetical protein EYR41_001205 [Orbilia oligospora]